MEHWITCTKAGVYYLTRGKKYHVTEQNESKKQIRTKADNGKSGWYPTSHFDLTGEEVPVLKAWYFNEPIVNALNGWDETNNLVEVSLRFDDESLRWCLMGTPDYFKDLLESRRPHEPMLYAKHLIIARDLLEETVEHILCHLDQQGELFDLSLPLESEGEDELMLDFGDDGQVDEP